VSKTGVVLGNFSHYVVKTLKMFVKKIM